MSDRPVDREAARERITEGRAFLGDWRENDNAIAARAHLADALDHLEVALAAEARVVQLEAQLAEARKIVHAAKIVNDLDTRESAGEDIDGYDWRRAFNDLDHALATVSVADSGPAPEGEKCIQCGKPTGSEKARICRECVEAVSGQETT